MTYKIVTYNDVDVHYLPELDGGGMGFGQQYVRYLRDNVGHVRRLFEWCAGPGFIGFSLLAHGVCDELRLADVNPAAIRAIRATIDANGLADQVHCYESDNLDQLADVQCDLVVGNPPHSGTAKPCPEIGKPPLIYMDPGWRLHRSFYAGISDHLRPGAKIIIQENGEFSSALDFAEMITAARLEIKRVDEGERGFYFLWSEPADR